MSRPWARPPRWAWLRRLPQGAQTQGHHNKVTVIADHLSNPRRLAAAPGGGLDLAEAGRGGATCVAGGEQGTTCIGLTGSFDLVTKHGVKRLTPASGVSSPATPPKCGPPA